MKLLLCGGARVRSRRRCDRRLSRSSRARGAIEAPLDVSWPRRRALGVTIFYWYFQPGFDFLVRALYIGTKTLFVVLMLEGAFTHRFTLRNRDRWIALVAYTIAGGLALDTLEKIGVGQHSIMGVMFTAGGIGAPQAHRVDLVARFLGCLLAFVEWRLSRAIARECFSRPRRRSTAAPNGCSHSAACWSSLHAFNTSCRRRTAIWSARRKNCAHWPIAIR